MTADPRHQLKVDRAMAVIDELGDEDQRVLMYAMDQIVYHENGNHGLMSAAIDERLNRYERKTRNAHRP